MIVAGDDWYARLSARYPDWYKRLRHRVGHRGATLLFFAFVYYVYAYSLFNPAPERRNGSLVVYLVSVAPLWIWGTLWLATAIIATISAFRTDDRLGFSACIALKAVWAMTLFFGAFRGVQGAYLSVAIWVGAALLLFNANSWAEPASGMPAPPIPPREADPTAGQESA